MRRHLSLYPGPVLIMGAGAMGCFIGGSLAAVGVSVLFVGRSRVLDELAMHGLHVRGLDGRERSLAADDSVLLAEMPVNVKPALVLLTVKSSATAQAAAALARHLAPEIPVLSLQAGLGNVERARQAAPGLQVIAGVPSFNVMQAAPGHFLQASRGALVVQDHPALEPWVAIFDAAGLHLELRRDMRGVQWAQLLLNLNNPVNALSGLPLREQLLDRDLRCCFAAAYREAQSILQVAGIQPARITPLPARLMPWLLRLPSALFWLLASRQLRMDSQARTSMADDFSLGRPSEIDAFCGEVVRLAQAHGRRAPVNERLMQLVLQWPLQRKPYTGRSLRQALGV